MKYIEKQTSPQAFELWKENKKNRQKDLAKIEDLTLAKMKTVKGIGDKKTEKYGNQFIEGLNKKEIFS